VVFADENLEAVVRKALEKPEEPLTKGVIRELTRLDASAREIEHLSGLGSAVNLTWLRLYENQISDVSPLASLPNLTTLELDAGLMGIHDKNLEAAVTSKLRSSGHTVFLAKETFEELTDLDASGREIEYLLGLDSAVNLTSLNLRENQISDVSPLASLTKLTSLNLSGNDIDDIGPLASLTNLTTLYLDNNQISDVSPLA